MKSFDVFISHSAVDKEFARTLARDIKENGYSVWLDEWNLVPGDSFAKVISEAIKSSKYLIAVMSPDYFASDWTTQEWQAALVEEIDAGNVKVLPLMYRDCKVPNPLFAKMWIDFREASSYESSLNRLLVGLESLTSEPENVTRPEATQTVGQSVQNLDSKTLTELTTVLKEAVKAFESKPAELVSNNQSSITSIVENDLCFIVMPFGSEELNVVYEDYVKPTLEEVCGLRCERGDDVFGSNVIMDDIRNSIDKAGLIVADLTGRNANVFYEVGIAHTLNRQVLLLAQSIDDVPFDLRHRRVLLYEYSPRGCKKLEKDIKAHIQAILSKSRT